MSNPSQTGTKASRTGNHETAASAGRADLPAEVVLVSWVAVANDPYERIRGSADFRLVNGERIPGPTLGLLLDPASPWTGRVKHFVLFHREAASGDSEREQRAVADLLSELRILLPDLRVDLVRWDGDDPTDHQAIFEFLRTALPRVRARHPTTPLLIHLSPGTPSMQTMWVLMVETGLVPQPVLLVKSYRPEDRRAGSPAVVPVDVGLETLYRAWLGSSPKSKSSEEDDIRWDPAKFRSERLKTTFALARRFAPLAVPVLITGERGTGKTTLANWIRATSPYRRKEIDREWPAVACGQYTPETMRSELFGHERGAFTGAVGKQAGLLSQAHNDTLFLDEIGDISRDVQRLLIKALEEGKYQPLGATRTVASRFRLLSATNVPDDILRERLDADFIDRIGTLRIRMPALRDIADDLPWLWQTTLTHASARAQVDGRWARLPERAHKHIVDHLRRHALPGNMRDLFHVAYRLLAARSDLQEPMTLDEAVDFGLDALRAEDSTTTTQASTSIAQAWSTGASLTGVFQASGRIDTATAIQALRSFLADEIRTIASTYQSRIEDVADVSERTLRNWKAPSRQLSVDNRQLIADSQRTRGGR